MSKQPLGAPPVYQLPAAVKARQSRHQQQAEALLRAYQDGDPAAIAEFRQYHPDGGKPGFTPSLLGARLLVSSSPVAVRRLSLEKLKKEAKELLKALKHNHAEALERATAHLNGARDPFKLADAQRIIARELP